MSQFRFENESANSGGAVDSIGNSGRQESELIGFKIDLASAVEGKSSLSLQYEKQVSFRPD